MGIMRLAQEAQNEITTIDAKEAISRKDDGELIFVDVRDVREMDKGGTIEGARHAPRGMIEFWFDPDSPYFRDVYGDKNKTYVLFCNGNPRSALCAKSLQDIDIMNVVQLTGGLPAWREAGGPIEKKNK